MDNQLIYSTDINTNQKKLMSSNPIEICTIPVGTIIQFAGPAISNGNLVSPPAGWLFCSGAEISRTTYKLLYNTIGTIYGTGNNTTTFNIPNLQSLFPICYNTTGTFNQLNKKLGSETVTLTQSNMPVHNHNVFSDVSLSSINNLTTTNYPASRYINFPTNVNNYSIAAYQGTTYNFLGLSSSAGNSVPTQHNNLPPYIVINYIIFTGV